MPSKIKTYLSSLKPNGSGTIFQGVTSTPNSRPFGGGRVDTTRFSSAGINFTSTPVPSTSQDDPMAGPASVLQTENATPPKPSKTTTLIEDFRALIPSLLDLLLQSDEPAIYPGSPCSCDLKLPALATCTDCTDYRLTCVECFLKNHRMAPYHWARVWDASAGYFIRRDMSELPGSQGLCLGHQGVKCPSTPSDAQGVTFLVFASNGVHRTTLHYCWCDSTPDRIKQLMLCRLFPSTPFQPRSAFTFQVIRQFHRLQLESKLSEYDFCGYLQRLTDNAFTDEVSDPRAQFNTVMEVWRLLSSIKRSGQHFGIDSLLPHRSKANVMVHCPVCPEPHVNQDHNKKAMPLHFRHLDQLQLTADGNHQANRYAKNSDPTSVSLFEGRAYFPLTSDYQSYLDTVADLTNEKTQCNNLAVLAGQNRKKFKNMLETGIVNVQCSHVFVLSTVDLQLGERFANTDYALAYALRQYAVIDGPDQLKHARSTDLVISYDIACAFSIHARDRFRQHFPDLADIIDNARWTIPLLHVQNHRDNCLYKFSSAYTANAGHFHGETAEQVWVELNQIGPQIRQMNNGRRQGYIIDTFQHWNWKKLSTMAETLLRETLEAREVYFHHRDRFHRLCTIYVHKLAEWHRLDREARDEVKKEVHCVYRESLAKVPTQKQMIASLLEAGTSLNATVSSQISDETAFLNEGMQLQYDLLVFKAGLELDINAPLDDPSLRARLKLWREKQKTLMNGIQIYLADQDARELALSEERLFFPSEFTQLERDSKGWANIGNVESKLREGAIYDTIGEIRQFVKTYAALSHRKAVHSRGQDQNTRASMQLRKINSKKSAMINYYNLNRDALWSLGLWSDTFTLPTMKPSDTTRLATDIKRQLGDSGRPGKTYRSRVVKEASETAVPEDGWIWRLATVAGFSNSALREWDDEGDRVHWFRAEAEMERWREQWECKLVEFMRCIRSFTKMSEVWKTLATTTTSFGGQIYARKTAAMYAKMAKTAEEKFVAAQVHDPIQYEWGTDILEFVKRHRRADLRNFHPSHIPRLLVYCKYDGSYYQTENN